VPPPAHPRGALPSSADRRRGRRGRRGLVIGRVAVLGLSNELRVISPVLEQVGLGDETVAFDALFTQSAVAQQSELPTSKGSWRSGGRDRTLTRRNVRSHIAG